MKTGIYCYVCHKFTETIGPITLKRFAWNKIKVNGVCKECLIGKCHEYEHTDYCELPKEIYLIPIGEIYVNDVYENKKKVLNLNETLGSFINSY